MRIEMEWAVSFGVLPAAGAAPMFKALTYPVCEGFRSTGDNFADLRAIYHFT